MKIGQILFENKKRVVVIEDDRVKVCPVEVPGTREIISGLRKGESLSDAVRFHTDGAEVFCMESDLIGGELGASLLKPINSPEVWACGVTYKRQALEHDADALKKLGRTEKLYYFVYAAERAEVFFKGLDRTMCGPGEALWVRGDSKQTLPEAELVAVLGNDGLPVAYTLGNDMTAWDIELDCPLYLNQAKIWKHSGSVGPFLQPKEDLGDPYACELNCRVVRDDRIVVDADGNTGDMKRSIEELCYYLNFNNPAEAGSLIFTGTACVIPHDFCLAEGDVVTVSMKGFGELVNTITVQPAPHRNFPLR